MGLRAEGSEVALATFGSLLRRDLGSGAGQAAGADPVNVAV